MHTLTCTFRGYLTLIKLKIFMNKSSVSRWKETELECEMYTVDQDSNAKKQNRCHGGHVFNYMLFLTELLDAYTTRYITQLKWIL